VWDTFAGLDQALVFIGISLSQDVDASCGSVEYSFRMETDQVFARNPMRGQVTGANDAISPEDAQDAVSG
jgi:hypothetical protein